MTERAGRKVAEVAVFVPLRKTFFYSFSAEDEPLLKPGVRVVVPFRNRDMVGVFTGFAGTDIETKKIKTVLDLSPLFPPALIELASWCADYYVCGLGELFKMIGPRESLKKKVSYRRGDIPPARLSPVDKSIYDNLEKPRSVATLLEKTALTQKELEKNIKPLIRKGVILKDEEYYFASSRLSPPVMEKRYSPSAEIKYTEEQKAAISLIYEKIERRDPKPTLLHGVTGSGKTEVYMATCEKALRDGGGAIVLVPEIALTFQFVKRFFARFGGNIAIMHSGLTPAQRREEWGRVQRGEARLVIGARSAIFAPMHDVRLVAVDEEHDTSYKQNEYPHYNARDVAVMLARMAGAAVVLGSATPSLESYHNAVTEKYSLCLMDKRIDDRPMPLVRLIPDTGNSGKVLQTEVIESVMERLNKKEQSLIFINRRGAARYMRCSACREVPGCPNCSITLTFHAATGRLACHYCGYSIPEPAKCPACGVGNTFAYRGTGTQKIESFLKEIFPNARVGRLDQDTAPTREKVFEILEDFEKGEIDILVGTQMTAKGHDFSNLTFTAVVGADDYLSFPDFRSAERTFCLLTQAAGRTGRDVKKGEVLVGGTEIHYAIRNAIAHDYPSFYREEILIRKRTAYPPFTRLVGILFDSTSEKILENEMAALARNIPALPPGVMPLGPVPALIYKIKNRYRWKMLLKGKSPKNLHAAIPSIENRVSDRIRVSVDVDPVGFY